MTIKPASSSTPIQGERKTVTVLFADVVGSTALAESLDPEEWAEIVRGMHACISEAVQRYDGLIAQLLGDGALAFFGAPVAHEDDPERAIRAGLDLLRSINDYEHDLQRSGQAQHFQMRVGLNTGLVVVGNIGVGQHVEYLAVGDTVNLAARMQSAAEPGTILITGHTERAARHAFDLHPVGALEIKGKAEPVPAFRVIAPKAQAENRRGIAGLDSPIVGRDAEIATLRSQLNALMQGQGGIVSIMGDAGLGKSRLLSEIVLRAPQDFNRLEARCQSYAATVPYAPIANALARLFQFEPSDDDATKLVKMRACLAEPARDGVPYLAALMNIALPDHEAASVRYLEPPQLRERVIEAFTRAIEADTANKPFALIVEDLHWADSGSLDVLERLLSVAARAPLLIVAAFRPQHEEPSWRFHEVALRDHAAHYTPVILQPLRENEARTLVGNLLYIEDLPEKVRSLILAKAEGNPFFVEEVIRSLLDAGLVVRDGDRWRATKDIVNIALPDTLAGVITARLDRLDEATKRLAQTAAVLGRDFSRELLGVVAETRDGMDDGLGTLVERELLQVKLDGAYHFKHVLTQEAAYNSLLLSRRKALHRRAAEALIGAGSPRAVEVARHFLETQEPQRALPYLIEAGEQAARAYSTPEAISLFTKAVEIAKMGDDVVLARRAFEGLGGALTFAMDPMRALEAYAAMEELAEARHDTPMRVSALNKMSYVQSMFLGQFSEAGAVLDTSERLARGCDDRAGLAEGLVMRCNVSTFKAEFEEGVKHLDTLVDVGRELNRDFETAFGLVHTANSWTYLARFDKAWLAANESRSFTESRGDLMHLSETLVFSYPFSLLSFGEVAAAYTSAEQGIKIGMRIGDLFSVIQGSLLAGSIARWQGDMALAMSHFERGQDAANSIGIPFAIAMLLAAKCGTLVEQDAANFEATREMHEQVQHLLVHPMGTVGGGSAWADLGECALALGRHDIARENFQKGLTTPTLMKHLNRPRLLVGMARVELAEGQVDAATAFVAEARAFAEARKMLWWYPLISLAEADVNAARLHDGSALVCYRSAEAQASAMGMTPLAQQARQGMVRLLAMTAREDL